MKRVDIFSKKYYTDFQDVDEDARTVVNHGGHWAYGKAAGVACRHTYDIHTNTYSHVASPTMKNWSVIIRIIMMSTKTRHPFWLKGGIGSRKAMWVSQIVICVILLQIHSILLLLEKK